MLSFLCSSARAALARRTALAGVALALGALASGCTPSIGSSCTQPTDCSSQGDRVCDTAQPGGYCTVLGCLGNAGAACPDNAVCVSFGAAVPGCPYDDYEAPARTGLSFCMKHCQQNSDCRDGYECADPRGAPWNAAILDNNQNQSVCIAAPPKDEGERSTQDGAVEGGVCTKSLPPLPDAFPPPPAAPEAEAGGTDASVVDATTADATAGDAGVADAAAD
jgi:hypothetical protein